MNLLVFGLGYSSQAFVTRVRPRFERVVGTVRTPGKAARVSEGGVEARVFPSEHPAAFSADIAAADALLVSVPPGRDGDPVIALFREAIVAAPQLSWIGYLSTVGVYGDHGGALVDETTPPSPVSERSRWRHAAELSWLELGRASGKPVHVFRLAGIYGPGRSAFDRLADGSAQRILRPGQVFNRIHVDDIAAALAASLDRPRAGAIYNVADNEPGPPADVITYAAGLAGVEPPPEVAFEDASLSPMALSFWGESKRVANRLLREELGLRLAYPTYREGLQAIWRERGRL